MFKSEVSKYNIVDATPFGRDVTAELAEACYKHGIKFGLYYSQELDWHHPHGGGYDKTCGCAGTTWFNSWDFPGRDNKDFSICFEEKIKPQVKEILTKYGDLCLIWFDTPGVIKPEQSRALFDMVKEYQPDCLINSRLGNGAYDYVSLGDNEIPKKRPENIPDTPAGDMNELDGFKYSPYDLYETAATLNDTWGFKYYDANWKTPEQIAANYAENKNSYDVFNYQYYLVQAATEETTGADGNTSTATTDATMAAAKATADKIAAATHDADSFTAAVTANVPAKESEDGTTTAPSVTDNTDTKGSGFSSAVYADWLYSADRHANDVTVVEQENSGYYVVLFESRDDNTYNTVNVRHILIKAEDSDSDGTYSDDDKKKAKDAIDDVYERWTQSGQTEDDFAQLANSFSQDSGSNTKGGLYENVYKGQMVQEFNDFCFDPARKPGDVGIVFNESDSYCGYHLVYYVGQGERYCDYLGDQALRTDDFSAWEDTFFDGWTSTDLKGMKYVG